MDPDWNTRPLDFLLGYEEGMALPEVRHPTEKQWHPEDAFRLRSTEDQHWWWMTTSRTGSKWRHLTERISKVILLREALVEGRRIARLMIEKGIADMSDVNDGDKDRAEEALAFAAGVIKTENVEIKHRLNAAKIVLDFCRSKPAAKADVTIHKAEDFLAAIDD